MTDADLVSVFVCFLCFFLKRFLRVFGILGYV